MRPFVLAAVAALALVAAPAAVAKEITQAQVCGTDGCTSVAGSADRAALTEGGPARTPPTAAPYYRVNMEIDHHGGFSYTAVPAQRAFRDDGDTWYEMPPAMVALITKAGSGRTAFPAAGLTGAAPAPKPHPAAAETGSPLWPEALLLALAVLAGSAFLVRGSRRFGPASD